MNILEQVANWNDLGPVAILFFLLVSFVWVTRWLLLKILADKDAQIVRANGLVDKATDETGATLKQILDTLREQQRQKEGRP